MTFREKVRWWWWDCWLRRKWDSISAWVMNRFWYKWNRIHIKTLDEQWHDRDYVLMHAMFQILVDFVEGEDPRVLVDDPNYLQGETEPSTIAAIERQEANRKELKALYLWWKNVYPNRKDPIETADSPNFDDMWGNDAAKRKAWDESEAGKKWHEACQKSWEFDDLCDKEDTEMMIRLIKVRHSLWT